MVGHTYPAASQQPWGGNDTTKQLVTKNHAYLGFEISTAYGPRKIKAAMVAMSCDLPARALVLNMKQFNGAYGCHLCEDPGESCSNSPMLRWWPYNGAVVGRTKESLLKNSLEVANTQEVVSCVQHYLSSLCPQFMHVLPWVHCVLCSVCVPGGGQFFLSFF